VSLKAGTRLFAQNSSCEVVVVRSAPAVDAVFCAGLEMLPAAPGAPGGQAPDGPGVELGKRYVDDAEQVEILCTKAGTGPLALAGRALSLKAPKPLPSSD
jgi:hypothetical protein